MLTAALSVLFLASAAFALLVLADAAVRGHTAYGRLTQAKDAAAGSQVRIMTFAVWTGEHAPSPVSQGPLRAAA